MALGGLACVDGRPDAFLYWLSDTRYARAMGEFYGALRALAHRPPYVGQPGELPPSRRVRF